MGRKREPSVKGLKWLPLNASKTILARAQILHSLGDLVNYLSREMNNLFIGVCLSVANTA
jgi:hypothetical protein